MLILLSLNLRLQNLNVPYFALMLQGRVLVVAGTGVACCVVLQKAR